MPIVEHAYQKQTTGYYCGAASTRVALSAGGVLLSQDQIAAELGTTTAGTDSIHDVTRVLNVHLGAGAYADVILPATITPADVDAFRARMVSTVDNYGGGVVNGAGTLLSLTGAAHTYSGGHYVAITGYDDAGHLWVSDVAAGEYWVTASVVAHWAAAGGYRGYAYKVSLSKVEADVATIVKIGLDYYALGSDGRARKLNLASQNGINDVGYVVSGKWGHTPDTPRPGLLPYTNKPIDHAPWIEIPVVPAGILELVDEPTVTPGEPGAVDAAAVVKALIASPDFAAFLKAQAFAGAQEAETK